MVGNRLLLVLISVLFLAGCGGKKSTGSNGGVKADLNFKSTPTGVSVYLDGQLVGQTPVLVKDVSEGKHTYELKAEGYQTYKGSINIISGGTKLIEVELIKFLKVKVVTDPEGATVWFDDAEQTGKTPLTIEDVPEGEHKVKVLLLGYFSEEKSLKISKDKDVWEVSFSLVKEPKVSKVVFLARNLDTGENLQLKSPFSSAFFLYRPENSTNFIVSYVIFEDFPLKEFKATLELVRDGKVERTKSRDCSTTEVFPDADIAKLPEEIRKELAGKPGFSYPWQNPDDEEAAREGRPPETYFKPGNYVLKVYNGPSLLGEASFQVQ